MSIKSWENPSSIAHVGANAGGMGGGMGAVID